MSTHALHGMRGLPQALAQVMHLQCGKPLAIHAGALMSLAQHAGSVPAMPAAQNDDAARQALMTLLAAPDGLTRRGREQVQKLLERTHTPVASMGEGGSESDMIAVCGTVAVINVWGVLRQYESEVCWGSYRWGTSYEGLLCALTTAVQTRGVTSIVLAIDSPGGSAVGLMKVCDAIAASPLPVVAVNRGLCCSAATALSVRCSQIVVEADAIGANIGTYTVLWDWSQYMNDAGIVVDVIKSGEHKGVGELGAEISAAQRAGVQAEVDYLAGLFKDQVRLGRNLSPGQVNELADGRCLIGQQLIDAGLADAIGTLDGVVMALQGVGTGSNRTGIGASGGVAARTGAAQAHGGAPRDRSSHMFRHSTRSLLLTAGAVGAAGFAAAGGNGGHGGLVPGIPGSTIGNTSPGMVNGVPARAPAIPGLPTGFAAGAVPVSARVNATDAGTCDPTDPEDPEKPEDKAEEPKDEAKSDSAARGGKKAKAKASEPKAAPTAGTGHDNAGGDGNVVLSAEQLQAMVDARVQQSLAANTTRLNAIVAAAQPFADVPGVQDVVNAAQADTTISIEAARAKILDAVAKSRTPVGVQSGAVSGFGSSVVAVGGGSSSAFVRDASLFLALQLVPGADMILAGGGLNAEKLAAKLGFTANGSVKASQVALRAAQAFESSGMASVSMTDIAALCVQRAGVRAPFAARSVEMFKAAHSTSDFPALLQNIANKTLNLAAAQEVVTWDQWCSQGTATDFKQASIVSLSEAQNMAKVPEGGTPTRVSFNERKATIAVETYASRFAYTLQMFLNDDLGAFTQIPASFGQASERVPEDLVYTLLQSNSFNGPTMSDSLAYFNAGHNNILSAAALSAGSLKAAFTAMRKQTGYGKSKAKKSYTPDFVLVPPELEFTAEQLRTGTVEPGTGSQNVNVPNVLAGRFRTIVADRLTSATRWYLGARQAQAKAIEVRFLNGQRGVQIDRITDGNPLEMTMQATLFGVGAAMVDPEALQRNDGA